MSQQRSLGRQAEMGRARAAGMASATRGRSRVFRDRSKADDGGEAEIREGMEVLARRMVAKAALQAAPDPEWEWEQPELYADWEF